MGLSDLLKSNKTIYEEKVGKMDGTRVQQLLDLVPLEMKKMLLSEISGVDYNPNQPKEQQERMAKLLDEAQKMPAREKLKLLTLNTNKLYFLRDARQTAETCSFLQSKWQEIEEHYGKKITEKVPIQITLPFGTGDCTYSDVIKRAGLSDNVASIGALAYTLLLDAHKKGTRVIPFCGPYIKDDAQRAEKLDQKYSRALQNLDNERERTEQKEAAKKAHIAAILGTGR